MILTVYELQYSQKHIDLWMIWVSSTEFIVTWTNISPPNWEVQLQFSCSINRLFSINSILGSIFMWKMLFSKSGRSNASKMSRVTIKYKFLSPTSDMLNQKSLCAYWIFIYLNWFVENLKPGKSGVSGLEISSGIRSGKVTSLYLPWASDLYHLTSPWRNYLKSLRWMLTWGLPWSFQKM